MFTLKPKYDWSKDISSKHVSPKHFRYFIVHIKCRFPTHFIYGLIYAVAWYLHTFFTPQLWNGAGNYCNSCTLVLWFGASFQARRRRRATQRLRTRRHSRFLRYKIFRFRQAQQYIAPVGLSFSCSTRTCGVVCPRTVWALASSSPHSSAILNVCGLIMIEKNYLTRLFQSCSE